MKYLKTQVLSIFIMFFMTLIILKIQSLSKPEIVEKQTFYVAEIKENSQFVEVNFFVDTVGPLYKGRVNDIKRLRSDNKGKYSLGQRVQINCTVDTVKNEIVLIHPVGGEVIWQKFGMWMLKNF